MPSITDIIKAHAPEIAASRERDRDRGVARANTQPEPRSRPSTTSRTNVASPRSSSGSGYGIVLENRQARWNEEFSRPYASRVLEDDIGSTRSSMDSVAQEVEHTLNLNVSPPKRGASPGKSVLASPPTSASTVTAFPSTSKGNGVGSSSTRVVMPDDYERARRPSTSSVAKGRSASVPFPSSAVTGGSPRVVGASKDKNRDTAMALASYLRSPRLTKLFTLKRKPHSSSQPGAATLQVSLCDVGE